MAAKKRGRSEDRHASGFMVRLPDAYRVKLAELKRQTDRPYTAELRRALDAHLKSHGIDPPAAST